jgi:hypothetical protein
MRSLAAALAVLLLVGCSPGTKTVAGPTVTATATVAGPTTTATVTATPTKVIATRILTHTVTYTPPPPAQFGEGTYVVGTDIKPGTYKTAGSPGCYWARLSSLNTSDILDNSNSTGVQTVQVASSDKAFEVSGSCTFGRVG